MVVHWQAAAGADAEQPIAPDDGGSAPTAADADAAAAANAAATAELSRQFNKADFAVMRPLGQFNLGFIIARLEQDLFIIDQHAAGGAIGVVAVSMQHEKK